LRTRLSRRVEHALELAAGADATIAERVACLLLAEILDEAEEPDATDVLLELLTERPEAAPLLHALVRVGPPAVAREAATRVVDDGPPAPVVQDMQAIQVDDSEVLLVALQREGERWYHGSVILEDREDGPRLVAVALGPGQAGQSPEQALADIAGGQATTYKPEPAELQRRLSAAADSSRVAGSGVGAETTAAFPIVAVALGLDAADAWGLSITGGPSTLLVDPGDEAAFRTLLEELVGDLEGWSTEHVEHATGLEALALELLLETKWATGEHDLGRWTADELRVLLRRDLVRVGIEPEIIGDLPAAFANALAFLHDRGQLAGEPLPTLELALDELRTELLNRLGAGRAAAAAAARKAKAKSKRKAAKQARRRNR
jgi:hypothetical protein